MPLGPLYVAAKIRDLGHEVILTSLLEGHEPCDGEVAPADAFLISFSTPQFDESVRMCHYVRRIHPKGVVVAGGPHPTSRPKETLMAGFDAIVTGEFEDIALQFLDDLENSSLKRIYNGQPVEDLDSVPFPARDLLIESHIRNDELAVMKQEYTGLGVVSLMCTRGCPFNCAFCSNLVMGRRVRFRSPGNVMDEVAWVVDNIGVTSFKIQDDTFTLNKNYVRELAEASKSRFGDKVTYRVNTRVDVFDEEVAQYLLDMNVRLVAFGFESGSQRVLDKVNKKITIEQSLVAARISKESGFDSTIGLMMFGLPGETRETIEEYKEFLTRIRPYVDVMNLATTIPYPGSAIGERPEAFDAKILCHDYRRYWIVNQKDVLLLPDGIPTIEAYDELRRSLFRHLIKLGWRKKEWESDAISNLL